MRIFELLSEASVFSRGTYSYGHTVKVATNSEKGKSLLNVLQKSVPDFGPEEILTWVEKPSPKSTKVVFGKLTGNERYFQRNNGEIITIQGSDKSIESALNHAGKAIKFNRGDIAEGVLGAAITAKLIKRGSDRIGDITPEDVKSVLSAAMSKSNDTLIYKVNDRNSQIADKIVFSIKLTGPSLEIIADKSQWNKFENLFDSSAHYANTADAERYSEYFYKNGKVDEVYITSDGLSGQKSRKTDISVVVKDPETGKVRNLKNVDISLKADSKQFGQIGTGGLSGGYEKWMLSAKKLFEPFGINIEDINARGAKKDIVTFFKAAYIQAGEKLNQELAGSNLRKETTFVEKVADVIFHQATLKVPNVRIVNLEQGQSTIHSFASLKQRMLNANVDLTAGTSIGRSGYPTITIADKNSGKVLVKIRYFSTKLGDKSAHVFEKGPLLHELTMLVKDKSKLIRPPQVINPKVLPKNNTASQTNQTPVVNKDTDQDQNLDDRG
jgi:hypothetical protein